MNANSLSFGRDEAGESGMMDAASFELAIRDCKEHGLDPLNFRTQ